LVDAMVAVIVIVVCIFSFSLRKMVSRNPSKP